MDVVIKLNNETNSRDKIARLIQYTSRLIWHQLEIRQANKYSVDRIKNLEITFSTFQKILRIGLCVNSFHSALNTLNIADPIIKLSLTISKIANGFYLYCDHVVWFTKAGFLKSDSDSWNKTANKFWLLSIIANLARDFYEIVHILELHSSKYLKRSDLLRTCDNINWTHQIKHVLNIVNCHKDVFIDTLKNSCDLFIPLTALGFTRFSPSTVGTLGAVSSLAALVTIARPITKLVPA